MVEFHTVTPRRVPERRIEIAKTRHPTKGAGWWIVSMFAHDGDGTIVQEITDEAMTVEGMRSRAEELARSKCIHDVYDLPPR